MHALWGTGWEGKAAVGESSWQGGGTSGTQKQCAAVRWYRKMSADQHYPMLSASRPDLFVTALGYRFIRNKEGTAIKTICRSEFVKRTMFSLEFWQTSYFGKLQCPNMLEQGFTFSREMAFGERIFAVLGTICPNLVKL